MERKGFPSFAFEFVSFGEAVKEVNNLSIIKASQTLDIPQRVSKIKFGSYFVHSNFNNTLSGSGYPNSLKYAEVTPVFKKIDISDKSNSSYS